MGRIFSNLKGGYCQTSALLGGGHFQFLKLEKKNLPSPSINNDRSLSSQITIILHCLLLSPENLCSVVQLDQRVAATIVSELVRSQAFQLLAWQSQSSPFQSIAVVTKRMEDAIVQVGNFFFEEKLRQMGLIFASACTIIIFKHIFV